MTESSSLARNPLGKSDYRADIDGLRAIAVLAVVAYHAFPTSISGGFIGVDIFFVISGYLISKHIWEDLSAGRYSLQTFYARRVRRIFPALAVVLLASLLVGWITLTPGEYQQLGKHVTGGAGFVSNILYWKEAGYFDNASDTKPLLHLWSLGIEEQFYILWPLLLAFLWRRPRHAHWVLPCVWGLSLGYSLWLVQRDIVADFYSPLTRCWELATGALLAHEFTQRWAPSHTQRNLLSLSGLLLIILGLGSLDSHAPFPGAWALLPALGAAAMILAGSHAWLNHHLLAHRRLVWVGLISYPLYLWHWPLLSFARILEAATPSPAVRASLVLTSVVLAWLTFRWVERPIRTRPRTRRIIWTLCLSLLAVAVAGEAVRKQDGVKSRTLSLLNGNPETLSLGKDRDRLQHQCALKESDQSRFQYCLQSAQHPRFALLGDSKAEALYYGLVRESTPAQPWTMIGSVSAPAPLAPPSDKNRLALEAILNDSNISVVGWAVALRGLFPIDAETGFITAKTSPIASLQAFDLAIERLEKAGKRVFFVTDNPTFPDPRSCVSGSLTRLPGLEQLLYRKQNPHCTLSYSDHLAGTQPYREFVTELKRRHPTLAVYDPTPILCDIPGDVCTVVTRNGNFLYSYGDHISDYANSLIARDLLPAIQRLAD